MAKHLVALIGVVLCAEAVAGPPEVVSVKAVDDEVGLYEKLELRIDLQASFRNPYDPDEVDVWAEFTAPSGRNWTIPGFYNPSSYRQRWMVRFAPTEVGGWRYVVKVRDAEGTAESDAGEFVTVKSLHHGFLKVAPNRRYLRYDDGTSFYGVGLWYNDAYELFNEGRITEDGLDELKRRGVNFISFYTTPLETFGTGLGRYDQNRAGRLDQVFDWCEARDIHISWNIWFHAYLSLTIWRGGNERYLVNPYRLVAAAADFYGSEEAWQYQEKLYRYIIARWGYSRALFLWYVVDEINGTDGWAHGDPQVAEAWCRRVHEYFDRHDPYERPTTGTQSGGIECWWAGGYQIFDIAAREIYEAHGHPMPKSGKPNLISENPLKFSYLNYAKQIQDLWNGFQKPAIIGETGWDHTYYEPGMPGYVALAHNALWVSLANGLSMTPFWWAYHPYVRDAVITDQLLHFADFVRDIDFANLDLQPAEVAAGEADGWALRSDSITFGWVVNPLGIANDSFAVSGLADQDYDVYLYRTWRGEYMAPQTVTAVDGQLTVAIPELKTTRGHANNIGDDVAFKIVPPGVALSTK